ncbi:MAG TPA: energy transducer TonB [Chthoniobacterales bacterium]|nr:energy transducer TonB [Chthoniobacterales bacterium]
MPVLKILLALTISLLLVRAALPNETADTGLHTFYGEVVLVDPAKKVIELTTGNQRLVFHYNDQTRIVGPNGKADLGKITRGTGAAVVMRVGEGNAGIAMVIRFVPNINKMESLANISARTVHGETIKGIAVSNYIEYQPPADAWAGGATLENRKSPGIFLLSVAPDGTISNVTLKVSTGYPELDARGEKWMKKWRFHPNTLTEVQLPMYYHHSRY